MFERIVVHNINTGISTEYVREDSDAAREHILSLMEQQYAISKSVICENTKTLYVNLVKAEEDR